jgi:hypothetical protein
MGEFLLDFKATGTDEFAKAAKDTTQALDRQEASARKMTKWRNELAQLARAEREAAEKKLPVEKQLENLLQRRAQLEERIARAGSNQTRLTALRLQQRRNEARIGGLRGQGGEAPQGANWRDLLSEIPGFSTGANLISKLSGALGGKLLPGAIIAGAAAGFIRMAKGVAEASHAMQELAEKARTTVQVIKSFSFASSATGVDFGNHTLPAFKELSRIQGELQAGIGRTTDRIKSLREFGVTMDDIRRKQPQQIFLQIIRAMEKGELTSQQYAAGVRLMGEAFTELIPAAKKGFVGLVEESAQSNSKFLDGTKEVLGKAIEEWDKFTAKLKRKASGLKTGVVGGAVSVSDLALAGIYNLAAPFSKKARDRRDELLGERENMKLGGDGSKEVDSMKSRLADAENNRKTRDEISSIRKELKTVAGDDAEDIIDDLDTRGAKIEDWRKTLSRIKRQKAKEGKGDSSKGTAPSAGGDALQRIGLFVGDPGGVRREIQKQSMLLADIKRGIEKLDSSVNKET